MTSSFDPKHVDTWSSSLYKFYKDSLSKDMISKDKDDLKNTALENTKIDLIIQLNIQNEDTPAFDFCCTLDNMKIISKLPKSKHIMLIKISNYPDLLTVSLDQYIECC